MLILSDQFFGIPALTMFALCEIWLCGILVLCEHRFVGHQIRFPGSSDLPALTLVLCALYAFSYTRYSFFLSFLDHRLIAAGSNL
jgi:hypothetical protein